MNQGQGYSLEFKVRPLQDENCFFSAVDARYKER